MKLSCAITCFLLFSCKFIFAQKTSFYTDPDISFRNGLELFDKKLYGAAQKSFLISISRTKNPKSLVRIDAEFFAAACALELFHKDGEWRFRKFIEDHPESNKIKWAYFYLGKSNFRKKKYDEVIKWLEQVEVYDLNQDDLAELYFKRGYSYFETGNFSKAKSDLYEIKDVDNKYAHPANYYYSHISYTEKNYEAAAEGFRRLIGNETFGPIVPFYIAQIYFLQAKYDSVIKLAPVLLNDTSKILRKSEINKLVGESFYRRQDYEKALPYLKNYGGITQDDNYEIAFALYKLGRKEEALPFFEYATSGNDTISQNAWYHLADCQLKTGEKTKARNSFYSAYKIGPNENVKEDALYSFAKLSYELSLTPYNEAINAFTEYINKYPNSPRKEEAYRFLVNVFASTQNYLEAMKAIDRINNPEPSLRTIYQRMAWNYGVKWYNENKLDSAQRYFNIAAKNNYDLRINALITYWNAEIKYKQKEYAAALELFRDFMSLSAAVGTKEYELAKYNIGYCYFIQKDYKNANISFRSFTSNTKQTDAEKMADGLIRSADCYFMLKDFAGAAENYETASVIGKKDIDYCIYQKSICNGILKNYNEKIADLKRLADLYPNSEYLKGSYLEIADAYIRAGESTYPSAIDFYNKFLQKYPKSASENSVKAQIGVLYYKLKDFDKALDYFYGLVKANPKAPESQVTAIPYIKNILLSQGKTDDWEKFAAANDIIVDKNEIEEAVYEKARDFYSKQDCDQSMPKAEEYISKFPNGTHLQEVHFWFSECAYSKGMYDKALPGYVYLLGQTTNALYTEKALTKAAFIYFKNQQFEEALPLYIRLQTVSEDANNKFTAKINAMRCAWKAKKYPEAAEQANQVLQSSKVKAEQIYEARNVRAHSLYAIGKTNESLDDWKFISKNAESVEGAEAYYHIAAIQFSAKQYKDMEKTVDKLMGYKYADKFWMTKGLLLMADAYTEQKKYSDAEALLQTIIDNQVDESLKEEAKKKLQAIKDLQNKRMNPNAQNAQDTLKIQFQNGGNKDLFDEMYEQIQNKQDTLKNNPQAPK
jgi:tetratricopeptide (TPR) repeat protein